MNKPPDEHLPLTPPSPPPPHLPTQPPPPESLLMAPAAPFAAPQFPQPAVQHPSLSVRPLQQQEQLQPTAASQHPQQEHLQPAAAAQQPQHHQQQQPDPQFQAPRLPGQMASSLEPRAAVATVPQKHSPGMQSSPSPQTPLSHPPPPPSSPPPPQQQQLPHDSHHTPTIAHQQPRSDNHTATVTHQQSHSEERTATVTQQQAHSDECGATFAQHHSLLLTPQDPKASHFPDLNHPTHPNNAPPRSSKPPAVATLSDNGLPVAAVRRSRMPRRRRLSVPTLPPASSPSPPPPSFPLLHRSVASATQAGGRNADACGQRLDSLNKAYHISVPPAIPLDSLPGGPLSSHPHPLTHHITHNPHPHNSNACTDLRQNHTHQTAALTSLYSRPSPSISPHFGNPTTKNTITTQTAAQASTPPRTHTHAHTHQHPSHTPPGWTFSLSDLHAAAAAASAAAAAATTPHDINSGTAQWMTAGAEAGPSGSVAGAHASLHKRLGGPDRLEDLMSSPFPRLPADVIATTVAPWGPSEVKALNLPHHVTKVCVCVFGFVRGCGCVCACVYVCVCVCAWNLFLSTAHNQHLHTHVTRACARARTHTYTNTHIPMHTSNTHIHTRTHTHTCTHTRLHTHTHTHTCTNTHTLTHTQTCTLTYTHTHSPTLLQVTAPEMEALWGPKPPIPITTSLHIEVSAV